MNSAELNKLKTYLESEENKILFSKGTEYVVSNDDRLNFFHEYANKLGADPKMVCAIFLMKHINSILNYVKTGKDSVEGIKGRIMDARNYLLFMEALIEETQDMEKIGCTSVDDEKDDYTKLPSIAKEFKEPCTAGCVVGQTFSNDNTSLTEDEVRSQEWEEQCKWELYAMNGDD